MRESKRIFLLTLVFILLLSSSCNLPLSTPTAVSSAVATDTPFESSTATSEPTMPGVSVVAEAVGEIFDLAFDAQGKIWAGMYRGAVRCSAGLTSCRYYSMANTQQVRAVAAGPEGSPWFGTTSGLVHDEAGIWETTTASDGLVANTIFDLQFDADGGLWIGTNNGVSHFANGVFTNYTISDGLPDDYIHCVYPAGEEGTWFGTSSGASHFDGVHWFTYDQNSVLPANDVLSIAEDTQGAIWLGTLFGGAVRFDGDQWLIYSLPGDEANVVQAIAVAPDEALWFGTRAGAFRFDGSEWLGYSTSEGLQSNDVRAIAVGADGVIFFGTNKGITRFEYSREKMRVIQEPVSPQSGSALPEGEPIPHLAPGEEIAISAIHMSDGNQGWGIGGLSGYGDHVLRTTDGGLTWQDVTPPEPAPEPGENDKMATGFFRDEITGWVIYHSVQSESGLEASDSAIWRTTDGGVTWQWSGAYSLDFVGSSFNPPYIDFPTSHDGWILARLGAAGMHRYPVYLYTTRDGGAYWSQLVDPYASVYLQSCQKTGMSFAGEQTGWVTIGSCPIDGVEIVITGDGGTTWNEKVLPAPDNQMDLFDRASCDSHSPTLFSTSHGALAISCLRWENDERVEDHYVYITEDAGETWQTFRYPGGTLLFIDTDSAYALSGDIYRSQDGGETWTYVKSVSWEGQFSFVSQQLGWAVARSETEIALVKTDDGGQTWSIIEAAIAQE